MYMINHEFVILCVILSWFNIPVMADAEASAAERCIELRVIRGLSHFFTLGWKTQVINQIFWATFSSFESLYGWCRNDCSGTLHRIACNVPLGLRKSLSKEKIVEMPDQCKSRWVKNFYRVENFLKKNSLISIISIIFDHILTFERYSKIIQYV